MLDFPITSMFAAAFAIALVTLSVPISLRRLKVGEMVGDSLDEALRRRIRAQGNFIEYVPLGLITLGLVEAQGAADWLLLALGISLVIGRLLHAAGMYRVSATLRGLGMMFTYLSLIAGAVCLIVSVSYGWLAVLKHS